MVAAKPCKSHSFTVTTATLASAISCAPFISPGFEYWHKANLNGSFIKSFMSIKSHATLAILLTWYDHYEEREKGGVSSDERSFNTIKPIQYDYLVFSLVNCVICHETVHCDWSKVYILCLYLYSLHFFYKMYFVLLEQDMALKK